MIRAVEMLVSRGHALDDVLHRYTLDQFRAFVVACAENRKLELSGDAMAARMAYHGDKSRFEAFIRGLTPVGERKRSALPMTRERMRELTSLLSGR